MKVLVYSALLAALITVVTMVIAIPIGIFGYINLSDFIIQILAADWPMMPLVLLSAIGTGLADFLSGYGQYVLITIVAKGLEAYLVAYLIQKKHINAYVSFALGSLLMVTIYALGEIVLAGNFYIFFPAFMANLPQGVICFILASLLLKPYQKTIGKIING